MIIHSSTLSPEQKFDYLEKIVKQAPVRKSLKFQLARDIEMKIDIVIGKKGQLPQKKIDIPYCA